MVDGHEQLAAATPDANPVRVQAPEAAPPDFKLGNLLLYRSTAASTKQASSTYRSLTSIATDPEPLEHAWLRHSPTANPPELV